VVGACHERRRDGGFEPGGSVRCSRWERLLALVAVEPVPQPVLDGANGLTLLAGPANVVMQLSLLPVGHGVAKSEVESGRLDRHPLRRTRTTQSYLVISMFGTEEERRVVRRELNAVHARVHSEPTDPVQYDAFDPRLQLWVAACLYKGVEDCYKLVWGEPDAEVGSTLYRHATRLGTTLQVPEDMWPADRDEFEEYWRTRVSEIRMDSLTRSYLYDLVDLSAVFKPLGVFGAPFRFCLRPVGRFFTLGFLSQPFRDELGLPWDESHQRRFDLLVRLMGQALKSLPAPLRALPVNLRLGEIRLRIRLRGAVL
jgi:uncharacterized protein (DUF2236 family)